MKVPNNWTFKTPEVAKAFDEHVREQLPWYDIMSGAVAHLARHYIPENGLVIDLGCSTGNIGMLLEETLEARSCTFLPIDNSESMRSMYAGPGEFTLADISQIGFEPFDVAISFLSMMFIPLKYRGAMITRLLESAHPGGAIFVVDKFESIGGYVGTALSRLTLAGKVSAGADPQSIIAKELSLIGVQRPMKFEELPGAVEIFRFGEFAGVVIET